MKHKMSYKLITILLYLIVVLFTSCNGQTQNLDTCNVHYKNAKSGLNSYYINENKSLLSSALKEVELYSKCFGKSQKSVELKISLLSLLKEYEKAIEYISSLEESDFKYSYKKEMNYNYFLALLSESKSDTIKRNRFLNNAILSVQKYIDNNKFPSIKNNQEAFYDLFNMKNLILSKQSLVKQIDDLKTIYPNDIEFIDILRKTFEDDRKEVRPMN